MKITDVKTYLVNANEESTRQASRPRGRNWLFVKVETDAGLVGMFPHNAARTDMSMTLFLNEPTDYDGGELVVQLPTNVERIKLPAGDAVLYSGGLIHRVEPITRGRRLGAFAWVESMIRDPLQRQLVYDLQVLRTDMADKGADPEHINAVDNCYNNLIRMWAEF